VQPGVEPVGVAQAAQVEPRPEERILDCAGRLLIVAQDQAGDGELAIGSARRERLR
jgi:hypothetical protein